MSQELDLSRAIKDNAVLVEDLYRRRARYDYEGVFRNSFYAIGIVGLGWVSIKLGKMIAVSDGTMADITTIVTSPDEFIAVPDLQHYLALYPYCDPAGSKYTAPIPYISARTVIKYFRDHPEEWLDVKGVYAPEPETTETGEPIKLPEIKALEFADRVMSRAGPVLPVGIVGFNSLFEYLRVRKLRRSIVE